jgi:uncharacterized protein (TIGR03086 family)
MSNASEHHARVTGEFTKLVLGTTDWDAPSPVADWQAHDVVEHLLTWLPHVVQAWMGIELTDAPDVGWAERWQLRCAAVQGLLDDPATSTKVVETGPFGGQTFADVIDRIYTPDVYMHSWDLARATGQPVELDPGTARGMLDGMRGMEQMLRESGQYGPAHPTASSDPVDQLMGFIGRDPEWRPA